MIKHSDDENNINIIEFLYNELDNYNNTKNKKVILNNYVLTKACDNSSAAVLANYISDSHYGIFKYLITDVRIDEDQREFIKYCWEKFKLTY